MNDKVKVCLPRFYIRRLCSQCGDEDTVIANHGCPEHCGRTKEEALEDIFTDKLSSDRLALLEFLLTQAQLTLLVSTREPVSEPLAQALGNLSLCCKAIYDNRTEAVPKYTPRDNCC